MVIDKSKVIIRPEKSSEFEEVNELIFETFTEQHGLEIGRFMKEHFIEERKRETFIPELSLVAELEGGILVGEVALHKTDIVTDSERITQLVLSQCAVLPEYRNQGIMRMLVKYALNKARIMGYGAVFLGGDSNLYSRFGFKASSTYGIYHKDREKWGDEGYLVCVLETGALDGVIGTTYYYGG